MVRNGKAQERTVQLGAGSVKMQAPRVDDRRPEERFSSRILPPYMRRSPRLEEALPVLYLEGCRRGLHGSVAGVVGAKSGWVFATTINRLLGVWQEEYKAWRKRSLAGEEYVYVWADGVYFNVRLEEDRLACLVIIGVLPDGRKEVIAIEDGYRESKESWASLLRDLSGGACAPVLAVGDGALGFWAALREVYPETREQRCWMHKIANVLDKLPKRLQARAKEKLHEIMYAPDRKSAREEIRFRAELGPLSKGRQTLTKDQDECSPSSTSRQSTGVTCERPTRSNRLSPQSRRGRERRRVLARGRRAWRWLSSCSWPPSSAGERSMRLISLPW